MRLKSLLFLICCLVFSQTFAENLHLHPSINEAPKKSIEQTLQKDYVGNCRIKIVNNSRSTVRVRGVYADGSVIGFNIYRDDAPHFISLAYHGYCHNGMSITIRSPYSEILYSDWTDVGSVIRILPYLNNELKAELSK